MGCLAGTGGRTDDPLVVSFAKAISFIFQPNFNSLLGDSARSPNERCRLDTMGLLLGILSCAMFLASGKEGKGGIVNVIANPDVAQQSRAFSVTYFRRHLDAH
jgi:hypothetical protein